MSRRPGVACLLTVLCLALLASGPVAAQDGTPAIADGPQALVADGVSAPVRERADVSNLPGNGAALVMERVELPASSEIPQRTATGPEILLIESGSLRSGTSSGSHPPCRLAKHCC